MPHCGTGEVMERNCTNCAHFRRAPSETAEEQDFGECRAHPPLLIVVDDEPVSMYPLVTADEYCGEHRAAQ
jgi:hypothetical protein